jgi:hypothetical protein
MISTGSDWGNHTLNKRLARVATMAALALLASLAVPLAADAACKSYKHRAKVESDPFGADLAYLNLKIRVCYNGHKITKVGALDITPTFTNNAMGTMRFDGVSPFPTTEYREWRGHNKGSYFVKAGGNFHQALPGPLPDTDRYIWASMQIYGNGTVHKDRANG